MYVEFDERVPPAAMARAVGSRSTGRDREPVYLVVRRPAKSAGSLGMALRALRETLCCELGIAASGTAALSSFVLADLVEHGLTHVEFTLRPSTTSDEGSCHAAALDELRGWIGPWCGAEWSAPRGALPLRIPPVELDIRLPVDAGAVRAPDVFARSVGLAVALARRVHLELWPARARANGARLPSFDGVQELVLDLVKRYGRAWSEGRGASLGLGGPVGIPLCALGQAPERLPMFRVGPRDWNDVENRVVPEGPCAHCAVARACRATRAVSGDPFELRAWHSYLEPLAGIPDAWRASAPGAASAGRSQAAPAERCLRSFSERRLWGLPVERHLRMSREDLPRASSEPEAFPVLLVRLPLDSAGRGTIDARFPPLSLLRLHSLLRARGFRTRCLDLAVATRAGVRSEGDWAASAIREAARSVSASVIGISIEDDHAGALAERLLRGRLVPGTYTVAGGRWIDDGVTLLDRCGGLDFVVEGEGEAPLLGLLDSLKTGAEPRSVPGLAWRSGRRAVRGPLALHAADTYPVPVLDGFDIGKYPNATGESAVLFQGEPFVPEIFVAGCPYRCGFCGDTRAGRVTTRSPERVAADLRAGIDAGVRNFVFLNTLINPTRAYLRRLVSRLRSEALEIRWSDSAHPGGLDAEALQALRSCGCVMLSWGVDAASARLARRVEKSLDPASASRAIAWSHAAGIKNVVNLIQGLPYESEADVDATCAWLRTNRDAIWRARVMPYQFLRTSPMALEPERYGLRRRDGGGFDEVSGLAWEEKQRQIEESTRHVKSVATSLGLAGPLSG